MLLKPVNEITVLSQIKVSIKLYNTIFGIKYSVCDLLCDVTN